MFFVPAVGWSSGGPALEWQTSFDGGSFGEGLEPEWAGFTIRVRIPAAELSLSGTKCRLTVAATASGTIHIGAAYIQEANTGATQPVIFAGTPVQITAGGNAAFQIPTSSTTTTDEIDLAIDSSKNYVLSMYIAPTGDGTLPRINDSGWADGYKSGDHAGATGGDGTWTTGSNFRYLLSKVEVLAPI